MHDQLVQFANLTTSESSLVRDDRSYDVYIAVGAKCTSSWPPQGRCKWYTYVLVDEDKRCVYVRAKN
jgi:hypothetical protein